MTKIFRNLLFVDTALLVISWYFWAVRFNLDLAPIRYASIVFLINVILAWWVQTRHFNTAYFLLGASGFVSIMNLILLRALIHFR